MNLLRIAHTWITQQLRLRAIDALDRSHARRYERTRHVQGRY